MKTNIKNLSDCELSLMVSNTDSLYILRNNFNLLMIKINELYIYNIKQLLTLINYLNK